MGKPAIYVKLHHVKTEEVTFKEPDDVFIEKFSEDNLEVGVGVNFSHDIEKESFIVHLHFFYDYNDGQNPPVKLLTYKGAFEFIINNLKENIEIKERSFKLPDNVLATLLGISISSARGIIIAKTAGAFINKYYLPIFDPKSILDGLREEEAD